LPNWANPPVALIAANNLFLAIFPCRALPDRRRRLHTSARPPRRRATLPYFVFPESGFPSPPHKRRAFKEELITTTSAPCFLRGPLMGERLAGAEKEVKSKTVNELEPARKVYH
jgi:hypothetical protein